MLKSPLVWLSGIGKQSVPTKHFILQVISFSFMSSPKYSASNAPDSLLNKGQNSIFQPFPAKIPNRRHSIKCLHLHLYLGLVSWVTVPRGLQNPAFALIFCCLCLEMLTNLNQGALHFHFALQVKLLVLFKGDCCLADRHFFPLLPHSQAFL